LKKRKAKDISQIYTSSKGSVGRGIPVEGKGLEREDDPLGLLEEVEGSVLKRKKTSG